MSGEKGAAPTPPSGGGAEAQLKYENDRLKLALAQSSANAKVFNNIQEGRGLLNVNYSGTQSFLTSKKLGT